MTSLTNYGWGEYPKEFKFVGWHPHCRCFVTAKLADYDEMNRWSVMSEEEKANYVFKDTVKDVPEGYKNWMADNAERIAKAKSTPYFIKDNYTGGVVEGGFKWQQDKTITLERLNDIGILKQGSLIDIN